MVPTGTFRVLLYPSLPVQFEPSPWRPRWASCSGLKRKTTSVLWLWVASMMTSPPLPPSPPEGPPRGTYFSRRNAIQPLPPLPAFTRILASSMNIRIGEHAAPKKNSLSQGRGLPLRELENRTAEGGRSHANLL